MNVDAKLTKRETEMAELFAWGATKKDIANRLIVSIRTVENTARNIFQKTGVTKINELSAWWFCTKFNISFELSPLKRKIVSAVLFLLLLPQIYGNSDDTMIRQIRTRTTKTARARRSGRKNENEFNIEFYEQNFS